MLFQHRSVNTRYRLIICSVVVLLLIATTYYFLFFRISKQPDVPDNLPTYTATTLTPYNGSNENLPIYIALDGYVYDVTAGKSYYTLGGAYHNLAGKDASKELRLFGGNIIKEKYPVIGNFVTSP